MRKNFAVAQHPSVERGLRKLLSLSFRRRFYLPPQDTCQYTGQKKGEERGDSSQSSPLFGVFLGQGPRECISEPAAQTDG